MYHNVQACDIQGLALGKAGDLGALVWLACPIDCYGCDDPFWICSKFGGGKWTLLSFQVNNQWFLKGKPIKVCMKRKELVLLMSECSNVAVCICTLFCRLCSSYQRFAWRTGFIIIRLQHTTAELQTVLLLYIQLDIWQIWGEKLT